LPAAHTSQVVFRPSIVEAVPSSHRLQSRSVVLEHALQPGNVLYLPTEQRMHGPPVGPHLPAMHEQLSLSNESGWEYVPSEHWACTPA
jgi:hypothetical protein